MQFAPTVRREYAQAMSLLSLAVGPRPLYNEELNHYDSYTIAFSSRFRLRPAERIRRLLST